LLHLEEQLQLNNILFGETHRCPNLSRKVTVPPVPKRPSISCHKVSVRITHTSEDTVRDIVRCGNLNQERKEIGSLSSSTGKVEPKKFQQRRNLLQSSNFTTSG
jgi:hypothetical protein